MLIEIIWNHLLHVEWFLFLLLLFSFINLDWIIQDWLDSEAVHPGDGWFDSLLIFSSYEVTVEWLFHEEPEQRLSKNLLSKFHQLKQGWCFRNSFSISFRLPWHCAPREVWHHKERGQRRLGELQKSSCFCRQLYNNIFKMTVKLGQINNSLVVIEGEVQLILASNRSSVETFGWRCSHPVMQLWKNLWHTALNWWRWKYFNIKISFIEIFYRKLNCENLNF